MSPPIDENDPNENAITGTSKVGHGIVGKSTATDGIAGTSLAKFASGVIGTNNYLSPASIVAINKKIKKFLGAGVFGLNVGQNHGPGVRGHSSLGDGVLGTSSSSNTAGVRGEHIQARHSKGSIGYLNPSPQKYERSGVLGIYRGGDYGVGVGGHSSTGDGVLGMSTTQKFNGVVGMNTFSEPAPKPSRPGYPEIVPDPPDWPEFSYDSLQSGNGLLGISTNTAAGGVCGIHQGRHGAGIVGANSEGDAIIGQGQFRGVVGIGNRGVVGLSPDGIGTQLAKPVPSKAGVQFSLQFNMGGTGVQGISRGGVGVHGISQAAGPGIVGHVQVEPEGETQTLVRAYIDQFTPTSKDKTTPINLGPAELQDGIGDFSNGRYEIIETTGPIGVIGRGPIGVKGVGNPGVVGIDKEGDRQATMSQARHGVKLTNYEVRLLRDAGKRSGVYARGNPALYLETRGENLVVGERLEQANDASREDSYKVFVVTNQGCGYFQSGIRIGGASNARVASDNLIEAEALQFDGTIDRVFYLDATGRGHFKNGYDASGFDLAESFWIADIAIPGMVVEVDPDNDGRFRTCCTAESTRVAGVVSANPGVSLGSWGEHASLPKIALAGRISVKATTEGGQIRPGDLLVSASTAGHAMCAPAQPRPGTVIGKALSRLISGAGEVEMLVMLR